MCSLSLSLQVKWGPIIRLPSWKEIHNISCCVSFLAGNKNHMLISLSPGEARVLIWLASWKEIHSISCYFSFRAGNKIICLFLSPGEVRAHIRLASWKDIHNISCYFSFLAGNKNHMLILSESFHIDNGQSGQTRDPQWEKHCTSIVNTKKAMLQFRTSQAP